MRVTATGKYCVLCKKTWGPEMHRCCTEGSLVGTRKTGVFRSRTEFLGDNDSPLSALALEQRRDKERDILSREMIKCRNCGHLGTGIVEFFATSCRRTCTECGSAHVFPCSEESAPKTDSQVPTSGVWDQQRPDTTELSVILQELQCGEYAANATPEEVKGLAQTQQILLKKGGQSEAAKVLASVLVASAEKIPSNLLHYLTTVQLFYTTWEKEDSDGFMCDVRHHVDCRELRQLARREALRRLKEENLPHRIQQRRLFEIPTLKLWPETTRWLLALASVCVAVAPNIVILNPFYGWIAIGAASSFFILVLLYSEACTQCSLRMCPVCSTLFLDPASIQRPIDTEPIESLPNCPMEGCSGEVQDCNDVTSYQVLLMFSIAFIVLSWILGGLALLFPFGGGERMPQAIGWFFILYFFLSIAWLMNLLGDGPESLVQFRIATIASGPKIRYECPICEFSIHRPADSPSPHCPWCTYRYTVGKVRHYEMEMQDTW